jgi:propionyl-CoA synthetase
MLTHSHDVVAGDREVVQLVRDRICPVASFKTALVVAGLPKTRSGKILRGTMRRIADGEDYPLPATIDDPAVLGEIAGALEKAGYGAVATARDR